jgi:hypothetical protein
MKTLLAVLALSGLAAAVSAEEAAGKLTFKTAGFSIAALDEKGDGPTQVLMMFLPASDGFAPNVNVQLQPFAGEIGAYAELSRSQMKNAGLKVLSERTVDKSVLEFEYSGTSQGKPLHWYARAALRGRTVYLATATATEGQWPRVGAKLKACVDSLAPLSDAPEAAR